MARKSKKGWSAKVVPLDRDELAEYVASEGAFKSQAHEEEAESEQHLSNQATVLRQFLREITRYMGVLKAEQKTASITFEQGHALLELDRLGPMSCGELADILWISRSSATRLVDHLRRKKEWVSLDEDPNDRRRKIVQLTHQGRSALEKLNRECDARETVALGVLTEEWRRTVLLGVAAYAESCRVTREPPTT